MKFGIAKQDITPATPIFQAGFGSRNRKSEGVLQPIFMKAVLLQANKTVLIVAFDAMGADRSFVDGIKNALLERFGLAHDEVLLNFSHAHSSVYLTGLDVSQRQGLWSIGQDHCPADDVEGGFEADEAYFRSLCDALLEMVAACYENLREGELAIASADSDFSISRRLPAADGKMAFAPNPDAEIDRQLSVFKLTDSAGEIKGILYCHGSHPTTLSDTYLIANDFISFTALALEQEYPEAISVFLQACGAELKPLATVQGGGFAPCDAPAVEAMGRALAAEVSVIVQQASFHTVECQFKTALESCTLPAAPDAIEFYRNILQADEPGGFEYSCATRALAARLEGTAKETLPCFVAVWQLDSRTHLVAIEGEVSTEYSLAIKRYFSKGDMVVLGYSNGVPCYIPTGKMIAEGGYEAECNYFFGLQGPFVAEIEDIIIGRVARLLHQVQ